MASQCSICCSEFTSDGIHKIASLKCGHIFGYECILNWISYSERPQCPICAKPCRKAHIRIIYSDNISVIEEKQEQELVMKYLREKELRQRAEEENYSLKAQNDILKLALKTMEKEEKKGTCEKVMKTIKAVVNTSVAASEIRVDLSNSVLILFSKNTVYKFNINDGKMMSSLKYADIIHDIKISPFSDGLCMCGIGKRFLLSNMCCNNIVNAGALYSNVIYEKEHNSSVTAISFDRENKEVAYFGDNKGNFHVVHFISDRIEASKVSNYPIHGIESMNGVLYVSTLFEVIKIDINVARHDIIWSSKGDICTGISSSNGYILASIRDENLRITGLLFGDREIVIYPDIYQPNKRKNVICNGNIYFVDDEKGRVKVISAETLNVVHSYELSSPVKSVFANEDIVAIYMQTGVYLYGV